MGSFAKAVSNLKDTDLWEFVTESVTKQQTPILGICLGMQLMMEYSEEGNAHGFGWFRGNVRRFKVSDTLKYKVPHIGWNTISLAKPTMLAEGIENTDEFYFVHSYYVECEKESDVIFSTTYESAFTSGIQKDNLFGVQFHPEKSHDAGKLMLENFLTKI